MSKWLRCEIKRGQFSDEYSVKGKLFNGNEFSLFAQKNDLQLRNQPTHNRAVNGFIRVQTIDRKKDLSLVSLPQSTLENGRLITVKKSELKD